MSDQRSMLEEFEAVIQGAQARESADLVRALAVMVMDLAAVIHRNHPDDYDRALATCRLELQALQMRRRRPKFRGATAMWARAVDLLETARERGRSLLGSAR